MVEAWTIHGYQGRSIYCQHRPQELCINRVAVYWRLLVKFSYNLYLISTLRFIPCIVIGLLTSSCHNILEAQFSNPRILRNILVSFSTAHQVLCQQSYIDSQMHKDTQKFYLRPSLLSKMPPLQDLCTPHCTIQFSSVALQ